MQNSLIISFLLLIIALTDSALSNDRWFKRVSLKGQYSIAEAFVKDYGFPIGNQIVSSYGGGIGYFGAKSRVSIFINFHRSLYSIENSFLLYRDYSGYEGGLDFRYAMIKSNSVIRNSGIGALIYGNLDQYELIKQYMIYPSAGVLWFSSLNIFDMFKFCPVEVVIPITYSFRQSGQFLNIGLSLQAALKIP